MSEEATVNRDEAIAMLRAAMAPGLIMLLASVLAEAGINPGKLDAAQIRRLNTLMAEETANLRERAKAVGMRLRNRTLDEHGITELLSKTTDLVKMAARKATQRFKAEQIERQGPA